FGRPDVVGELQTRLAGVHPADIAAAAVKLRSSARAVLIAVPVGQRRAPMVKRPGAPSDPGRTRRQRPGPDPQLLLRAPDPRPPDFQVLKTPAHMPPEPRYGGLDDRTLGAGHRVTAIAHQASAGVEARLRLTLEDPDPRRAAWLAPLVAKVAGGGPDSVVRSSAGAITLSRCLDPDELPRWLQAVRSLLRDRLATADRPGVASGETRPQSGIPTLADQLCQVRYLGLDWEVGPPPASPGGAARADLVLVGPRGQRRLADLATDALDGIAGSTVFPPVLACGPGDLLLVPRPTAQASVALRAPQPPGTAGESARYVLIALLSGVGSMPCGGRSRLGMFAGSGLVVGRDVVAGHTSVFLGGTFPAANAAAVLRRLHHEVVGAMPVPDRDEVGRVRDFCAGQWLAVFDDPSLLADTVLQQIGYGRSPAELPSFASALPRADPASVAAAWHELLAGDPFTGVLVGDIQDAHLADLVPWPVRKCAPTRHL
ncbi:MAG: hypothetical protein ACRDZO_27065, partial [Egibacteraceae bacterium]